MPNGKELSFSGSGVSEETLRALEADSALEHLVIWGGPVADSLLARLGGLVQLKGLVLGEMPIDDCIFQHLRDLHGLTYLNLAYTNVEGDFSLLEGLPLRDVRLEGCGRVRDRCLETLSRFPSLRQLEVHMTRVTDAGVQHLAGSALEVLWLGGGITDAGMGAVGTMKSLRHLDVCSSRVTDEGVRLLTGLEQLEVLWLAQCSITDASVETLGQFRLLRELAIGGTGISVAGRERLRGMLPGCMVR